MFLALFLIRAILLIFLALLVQFPMEISMGFSTSFVHVVIGFKRVQRFLRCDFVTYTFGPSSFTKDILPGAQLGHSKLSTYFLYLGLTK